MFFLLITGSINTIANKLQQNTYSKGVKYKLAASVAPRKVMDESKKIYISESQVIILKNK